jgi:hypothetical protein
MSYPDTFRLTYREKDGHFRTLLEYADGEIIIHDQSTTRPPTFVERKMFEAFMQSERMSRATFEQVTKDCRLMRALPI